MDRTVMKSLPPMNKHQETGKIVTIYALFGCAWIYFSDTVLAWLVRDPESMTQIAIFKGLLFIVCTSVLLYFLIARLSEKIKDSTNALRESEERLRFLVKNSSDSVVILNADGSQRYVSPGAERITGFPVAELEGKAIDTLIHPDDMHDVMAAWNEAVLHPEKTVTVQYRHVHKTRGWVFSEAIAQSFLSEPAINGVIASVRDITERKQNEKARIKLEEQLQQAQKMEAIGQLAGGVAHDFNNMLGVILGHAELAMDVVGQSQPLLRANLEEIRKAAARSADITRQLLAFARKQLVSPKVIDLNETVAGMLKMLLRLIGEDINLLWQPGADLWRVKVDPSQIDQILANLCVNARDAIAGVGKITVETGNSTFDEDYCTSHTGFLSGEFVRMSVSDSGCGIDRETLQHIFEPFFTTKKVGEGTGLGLATVYGIVQQNHGFVNVCSEPGQGSTFTIYLPRHARTGAPGRDEAIEENALGGNETILLVEDEPTVLKMTTTMLNRLGYTVLAAGTPDEAIRLVAGGIGRIDLLLTDVIMPEMNGRTLAGRLLGYQAEMKCLFMSGYTANVISHHGVLDEGVCFIQKPFSKNELATQVREALKG